MTLPADAPSIGDHGAIGNLRTIALVDRAACINWMCWPAMDSPALLCGLLDADAGGRWTVGTADGAQPVSRRYLPGTNVLETTLRGGGSRLVVVDFMPVADTAGPNQLVRIVRVEGAPLEVRTELTPTPDFGRRRHRFRPVDGCTITSAGEELVVRSNAPIRLSAGGAGAEVCAIVGAGRPLVLALGDELPDEPLAGWAHERLEETGAWWRDWLRRCDLPVSFRSAAERSALTVKLLQHRPTSALVAAPTTSLPETIGGGRNWDYRYTWLRDAAMSVLALQRLGRHDEAMAFWRWLDEVTGRHDEEPAVMYTVRGEPVPGEQLLDHLPGFRGSRPVRVGNGAAGQRQLDVYGHVLTAAAHCYRNMDMDLARPAATLAAFADRAAGRWGEPDDSIWEMRSGRQQFLYSKVMCWAALDRAVSLATDGALRGDHHRWAEEREHVADAILRRGWNASRRAFTAVLDDDGEDGGGLDAAALTIPGVGLLEAGDPRCRSTREAVTAELGDHGFIRRYRADDGLDGEEGAFLLCTLWMADNHVLDDDADTGAAYIERVVGVGNDLGLLAEEVDPASGELLGNFPQALSHLGLIESIVRLDAATGGRPFRPT